MSRADFRQIFLKMSKHNVFNTIIATRRVYDLQMTRLLSFAFLTAMLLASCARQGSLTGGVRDTTPPAIDSLRSTPNLQTRFKDRAIKLFFNEWVTLNDVRNQVLISPPLATFPQIELKNKSVTLTFDEKEQLRDSTTYTINFGEAVKDLHEGNAAKDLRFVFSTGDQLDSLSLRGNVADAFKGEGIEKVTVLCYDVFGDSVIQKERPYYFAKTDKNGQFAIRNMRAGTFKIVAIEENLANLKWEGRDERIAFQREPISVSADSQAVVTLRMFKENAPLRLLEQQKNRFGYLKLGYSSRPENIALSSNDSTAVFVTEVLPDSLLIWYNRSSSEAWELYAGKDTVAIKSLDRDAFFEKYKFQPADAAAAPTSSRRAASTPIGLTPGAAPAPPTNPLRAITQNPGRPAMIRFNSPALQFDTSKWLLTLDSLPFRAFKVDTDSLQPRMVRLDLAWKPGGIYQLTLLPGALTDIYGIGTQDTFKYQLNVTGEKQLGGLNVELENLVPGQSYIFQLLNGTTIEQERSFKAEAGSKRFEFRSLPTAAYSYQVIIDDNANGRWDTGNYYQKIQPEQIFNKKGEAIRANWELEAVFAVPKN